MTECVIGCLELEAIYGNLLGTAGNDNLTGNALFNAISGLAGNDTVMGGGLFDKLSGGDGIDTVSYANACSAVNVDLNKTGWQWTGGGFFDKLSGFENINGSKYNDCLIGDAQNNRISGGLGADRMVGGLGNDIYSVDNSGDKVVEKAGEGLDLVLSSISYTLGDNVENLSLFGTAINGTGNALNNIIAGNAENNVIAGKGGNDSVYGGAGADTFIYEYATAGNFQKVHDFAVGVDTVAIRGSVFGISASQFDADYFVFTATSAVNTDGSHTLATTADHGQFIVDRYHNFWWDADGSGAGNALLIGSFAAATLTFDDFALI